jgi:hypothetical protein
MHNVGVRLIQILALTLAGIICGCWLNQQPQVSDGNSSRAELLLKGTYGIRTDDDPSATRVKDQVTLDEFYQKLNTRQGGKAIETPQIDFTKFGILLLEMGQKPSGSYTINFDPSKTEVDNDKLVLHVRWDVPAQGMAVTQSVTSPFILLKVSTSDITSIRVFDQNNRSRFEVPIE